MSLKPEFRNIHKVVCDIINATSENALIIGSSNKDEYKKNVEILLRLAQNTIITDHAESECALIAQVTDWDAKMGALLYAYIRIAECIESVGCEPETKIGHASAEAN